MVKQVLLAIITIVLLGSCSSLKSLNLTNRKPVTSEPVAKSSSSNSELKFIDKISITPRSDISGPEVSNDKKDPTAGSFSIDDKAAKDEKKSVAEAIEERSQDVENTTDLQLKYAVLLNTDVEQLQNKALLKGVDEWYGTPYRMGGTTKGGIDCSAFVCAVFATVYSVSLPRMARDQYRYTHHISRTKLKEGDLLFFNTRGGVSHVGIYLQNNKFVHASTSKGVTVSDMFETYYLKRFIGAGRVENKQEPVASN
jgi:NlpC/P60 family